MKHWNLRYRTRQPEFVWRVAVAILAVGAAIAFVVQGSPLEPEAEPTKAKHPDRFEEYHTHVDQLAADGQWLDLWWQVPRGMWLGLAPGPTALAVITGICWFVFALQAGQPNRPAGIRWWLALLAVPLGVLSIWPTLFSIYWQEQNWELYDSTDLAGGLRFYILGVGLREELSKLLLFLPLVPWIVRRGSEREALLVAACVGLGFAMEENIQKICENAGGATPRFLTANFFHMALTGLIGLAVCRAIWNPRERAAESVAIVLLAIVAHGMYDALIVLPSLKEFSIGTYILYILLAYQFFHELRNWWQMPGETVSLTATFLVAVSVVTAAAFVYLSATMGFNAAIKIGMMPAVTMGVMVYMFLREMPESIIDV